MPDKKALAARPSQPTDAEIKQLITDLFGASIYSEPRPKMPEGYMGQYATPAEKAELLARQGMSPGAIVSEVRGTTGDKALPHEEKKGIPLTDYEVPASDGRVVKFRAPSSLSDDAVYRMADQQSGFESGRIPTTFMGGVKKGVPEDMAQHGAEYGAALGLGASLIPHPAAKAAAAASPLIGRGIQAAGEYLSGQPQTPLRDFEAPLLAAEGVAGAYGPGLIARGGRAFSQAVGRLPVSTLPQALAQGAASSINVGEIAEHLTPEAVSKTAGELVTGAKDLAVYGAKRGVRAYDQVVKTVIKKAISSKFGLAADEVEMFNDLLTKGYQPQNAAKIATSGDKTKMAGLISLFNRKIF